MLVVKNVGLSLPHPFLPRGHVDLTASPMVKMVWGMKARTGGRIRVVRRATGRTYARTEARTIDRGKYI